MEVQRIARARQRERAAALDVHVGDGGAVLPGKERAAGMDERAAVSDGHRHLVGLPVALVVQRAVDDGERPARARVARRAPAADLVGVASEVEGVVALVVERVPRARQRRRVRAREPFRGPVGERAVVAERGARLPVVCRCPERRGRKGDGKAEQRTEFELHFFNLLGVLLTGGSTPPLQLQYPTAARRFKKSERSFFAPHATGCPLTPA